MPGTLPKGISHPIQTLCSIDSTLSGVKQTLKDIEETYNNIDQLKDEYTKVMEKLSLKIAKSFTQINEPFKYLLPRIQKTIGSYL